MQLQSTFIQALTLAGLSHATRIYVSSYSGNITTVNLSPKIGGLEGNLTLTPVSQSTGCFPSPSWLEFDKKTSTLYCSDEGNTDPTKASFSSFQTSANGTLYMLDRITTLNGCVYSKIYENDTVLAIANYGGSGITIVDIEKPASLSILQQTSFVFAGPGPNTAKPLLPYIHQVIIDPTMQFLLAPDLTGDLIHVFDIGSEGMLDRVPTQQDVSVPKGHGPRHGFFWKPSAISNTTYLYMVFETANMVHGYSVTYNPDQTLNFTIFQDFPLPVPKGAKAAEIKLAPDNKYFIVSSRNDTGFSVPNIESTGGANMTSDSLFTFAISPNNGSFSLIQDFPAYGLGPRQFSINDNGTLVAVALDISNRLTIIGRDVATGMMTEMLGYLDLDVGGAPGLVTSAVWDEEDGSQSAPQGAGTYTDTTIAITLPTAASSGGPAPTSTSAALSSQSAVSPSSAATPASNSVAGGSSSLLSFVTTPPSGGSQPTSLAENTASAANPPPTTASGPTPSGTLSAGATPSPAQTGMVGNCVSFHQVVAGDTCSGIAAAATIALTDFYTWNPAVGSTCASLDAGFYACVAVGS